MSGWFELKDDARLGSCATDGCGGQPIWRLEADGIGSNYCSGCAERIRALVVETTMGAILDSPPNEATTATVADDVVARLRKWAAPTRGFHDSGYRTVHANFCAEAASLIASLQAEVSRVLKINEDHCRTVNTYIIDNARQAERVEAAEADRDRLLAEQTAEFSEMAAAIGMSVDPMRFLDPPDGGDVSLAEQVRRMGQALVSAETVASELLTRVNKLTEELNQTYTEAATGQSTQRLEAGGVGANYCSGCAARIRALSAPTSAADPDDGLVVRARFTAEVARPSPDGFTYLNQACRSMLRELATALASAEARAEKAEVLVERAFRDGLSYATNCVVTDPDEAWRTSKVRKEIMGGGNG